MYAKIVSSKGVGVLVVRRYSLTKSKKHNIIQTMKKFLHYLVVFLELMCPCCLFAKMDDQQYVNHVLEFQNLIKSNDKVALAERVKYPLRRAYPLKPVQNKNDFIKRYDEIFDEHQKKLILSVSPRENLEDKIYGKIGWYKSLEGTLMLKRQYIASFVDMDLDGNLINILLSNTESKAKRDIEKNGFKNPVGVPPFEQFVQIIKTEKFYIRIDKMDDGFRYMSWSVSKNKSDEPDLVLHKGTAEYIDDVDSLLEYTFTNNGYKYVVTNVLESAVNGDILYPILKVYDPKEQEILYQSGYMVYPL